jgi:hypothetical protein
MAKKAAVQSVSERPQPKTRSAAPVHAAPSHEEIAARAFEYYLQRGGGDGDGSEMSDWLRAEAELNTRH